MDHECKGCLIKQNDRHYICALDENLAFKNFINQCPCKRCLLKGICKYSCESFLNFLYVPLMENYIKKDQLKNSFNIAKSGLDHLPRIQLLRYLQYQRNMIDVNRDNKPRFPISSKLVIENENFFKSKNKFRIMKHECLGSSLK